MKLTGGAIFGHFEVWWSRMIQKTRSLRNGLTQRITACGIDVKKLRVGEVEVEDENFGRGSFATAELSHRSSPTKWSRAKACFQQTAFPYRLHLLQVGYKSYMLEDIL